MVRSEIKRHGSMKEMELSTATLWEVFSHRGLRIPDYQRPYKWSEENICRLFDDIEESRLKEGANSTEDKGVIYHIGSLILHVSDENEEREGGKHYDIVDGQQRLVSLALILTLLYEEESNAYCDFINVYLKNCHDRSDNISLQNLKSNFKFIKKKLNLNYQSCLPAEESGGESRESGNKRKIELREYIEHKCDFVVIVTDKLEVAFQMFDSQNSRGKKLYPQDLLKAYHLREMKNTRRSVIIGIIEKWESLDQHELYEFFDDYLFPIKSWSKGKSICSFTEKDIDVFKGIRKTDNYAYALYHQKATYASLLSNPFALNLTENSSYYFAPKNFQLSAPIIAGTHFFEYVFHYLSLKDRIVKLFESHETSSNCREIFNIINEQKSDLRKGSKITLEIFYMAQMCFLDKFKIEDDLENRISNAFMAIYEQFIVYSFVWIYSMRLQYERLSAKTAQNYVLENSDKVNSINLFRIIDSEDTPGKVINLLSANLIELSSGPENNKANVPENNKANFKKVYEEFRKLDYIKKNDDE